MARYGAACSSLVVTKLILIKWSVIRIKASSFFLVVRDRTLIKHIIQLLNLLERRNHLCIYLHLLDVLGVGTHLLDQCFLRTYNFWNKKVECMWVIRDSCVVYITVYIFFPVWSFFWCYIPFCFPRIWSIVLNGWNSYLLFSNYCFRYFINVSTKVMWNSSYDALYWWTVHISSFSTWTQLMTIIKWLSFLWWNLMHADLWYLYIFWHHFPMIMCIISTIYVMFKYWFYIWPC